MKTKMKKLVLVVALGAILGGCAAPGPVEPQGPRIPVNDPAHIEAFRVAEKERLRVRFEAEADARAREEQALRERATLQYLEQKQKHLDSKPRGLPPLPKRVVRKASPQMITEKAAPAPQAAPAAPAAPAVVPVVPPTAEAPPATGAPVTPAKPSSGPTFVPRRSAS
jgi:hypothetical protein